MVAMAVIGARSSHCRRWRHLPLLHRHTLLAYNKIFFFSFFGDDSYFGECFFRRNLIFFKNLNLRKTNDSFLGIFVAIFGNIFQQMLPSSHYTSSRGFKFLIFFQIFELTVC
jgi:hypothetical protein